MKLINNRFELVEYLRNDITEDVIINVFNSTYDINNEENCSSKQALEIAYDELLEFLKNEETENFIKLNIEDKIIRNVFEHIISCS